MEYLLIVLIIRFMLAVVSVKFYVEIAEFGLFNFKLLKISKLNSKYGRKKSFKIIFILMFKDIR